MFCDGASLFMEFLDVHRVNSLWVSGSVGYFFLVRPADLTSCALFSLQGMTGLQ